MDKDGSKASTRWGWVNAALPNLARLVAQRKAEVGAAHVALCWQRGVVQQLPGWFFGREGGVALGTPWADEQLQAWAGMPLQAGQTVLVMATPQWAAEQEATRGA